MMATLDQTIENPINGERVTFLVTSQETNGEFVKAKIELQPEALGPPLHYHLAFTEAFEVLQGRLDVAIGEKHNHSLLMAGQTAHIPINTVHRFWNSSNVPTAFVVEIRPARQFEKALRAAFGLARDGKVNKVGVPSNIWELALIFELSESFLPGAPLVLQKGIFGLLTKIARWKGYDPVFSKYTRALNS
jgi:mannose-6-phosphate isomerase-like protein (cupin superfamily)